MTRPYRKITNDTKICADCNIEFPLSEFPKGNKGRKKDYIYAYCKNCHIKRVEIIRLRRLFDMTPEDRDGLFKYQGDVCAICGISPKDGKRLHIDHNHKTGLIRGGLCWICNRILGIVRDDINRLEKAINYLKYPPAVSYFSEPKYGRLGRTTSKNSTIKKLEKNQDGLARAEMESLIKWRKENDDI